MFDSISGRYDFLNRLLSAGQDRRWRRKAVERLGLVGGEVLLDLCTGTGDLALEAVSSRAAPARVLGVDIAPAMLAVARAKAEAAARRGRPPIWLALADVSRLPVPDASVDLVSIAFGIRNVSDTSTAVREIARVLRPGGRVVVLEFGMPRTPCLGRAYGWYFRRVLPLVGRAVSGHSFAYAYLPASVAAFPAGDAFAAILREAGLSEVRFDRLTLGVVYLYMARRPR